MWYWVVSLAVVSLASDDIQLTGFGVLTVAGQ